MATRYGRYTITSPATSREVIEALETASKDGTLKANFEMTDPETNEVTNITFIISRSRPAEMVIEFVGKLDNGSTATIGAFTHPDLNGTPAKLRLVPQPTP